MPEASSKGEADASGPSGLFGRPIRAHYPVLILGAGINGCGLFRDLCAQGIECLLVDKGDFCSGASAGPSRLIHGGIKYLETGEFRLVRESALERNLLLRNAPHYVKPLETVLPIRSIWGGIWASMLRFLRMPAKLNDRGAIITEIGLSLYDLYGRHFRGMPRHRFLWSKALRAEMPALDKSLTAAGIYYEGRVTHAERLGMELIRDGLKLNTASTARNYVAATGCGEAGTVLLRDERSGETHAVSADIIVNAGGAWIDKINAVLGVNTRHMGGNKGAHLIVRNAGLFEALKGRMIYFGTRDGRVNLLYPLMGNVLIGSTDIPIDDPDTAICDEDETRYLLGVVTEIFPDIPVTRDEVVFTYWGVRPLPRSDGVDPGAVSRDHHVAEDRLPGGGTPILSLIGGKWTTFRGFSEQVADRILRDLGCARKVDTRILAIGGGKDFPADATARQAFVSNLARHAAVTKERAEALLDRYGTYAVPLAAEESSTSQKVLAALPHYSAAEIEHLCRTEAVFRLSDLLFRRTDIALAGHLSRAVIDETGGIAARSLGWDDVTLAAQVAETLRDAARHGVRLESVPPPNAVTSH